MRRDRGLRAGARVVAGGSRESDLDLLNKIAAALDGGASGCSIGRNIFQHANPEAMTRAICAVVKDRQDPEEALQELRWTLAT